MSVVLCGDDRLWAFDGWWRPLSCVLPHPTLLCRMNRTLFVLDNRSHLLWGGGNAVPIMRGVETMLPWEGDLLLLSGETNCLTRLHPETGQLVMTAHVGDNPQDACLMPGGMVAVCGGGDGLVRLLRGDTLQTVRTFALPGLPERIAYAGGALHVLCAVGDAVVRCRYFRLFGAGEPYALALLPGLPGAVCADGRGGVWVASSETLVHYAAKADQVDRAIQGTGLVRHMVCGSGQLLVCDPVMGSCTLFGISGMPAASWHGEVGQGVL